MDVGGPSKTHIKDLVLGGSIERCSRTFMRYSPVGSAQITAGASSEGTVGSGCLHHLFAS